MSNDDTLKAKRVYLSPPHMNGSELETIQEAFASNWIAPLGPNVDLFEQKVREMLGCQYSLALNSGSSCIHLALKYLGVKQGDYVFCSDVTFSGSCNAILYEKATPVFIDSERDSWNISPVALEKAFKAFASKGILPKVVIVVDLYGMPADYNKILPICRRYGVPVLEDAAEALGATYCGKHCGTLGDIGILSFNANKIITSSTGGMVLTDLPNATGKMKFWATQSREPCPYYEHKELGYNYRMSNILASIGLGQLLELQQYIQKRRKINQRYKELLADYPITFAQEPAGYYSNFWLSVGLIEQGSAVRPIDLISALEAANIESRHFWKPMHMQPLFSQFPFYSEEAESPVGEDLFLRGICLPSGSALTEGELTCTAQIIKKCFNNI
ncbi:MAG: DegT/DnrJ/EryC1/StrS family aminotransferase [Bacillota bacterium]